MNSGSKYRQLSEKANWWDNKPHSDINLNGRVLKWFSPSYFERRWGFVSNKYYEGLPTRERITSQRMLEEFAYRNEQRGKLTPQPLINMMNVPADVAEQWNSISPTKYFESYKNRKELLDRYLSNFDLETRNKYVQIMCSGDSINYVSFLEADPSKMSEQQRKIYEDVINYYEYYYIGEMQKQQSLSRQYLENQKLIDDISAIKNFNSTNQIEYEPPLSNLIQNENQRQLFEPSVEGEITIEPSKTDESEVINIKPLVFADAIKTADNMFAQRQAFTPNQNRQDIKVTVLKDFQTLPNLQLKNLFNVPQCYNIGDLISARKQAEDTNRTIIHDIVVDQIHTNNEVANYKIDSAKAKTPVKVSLSKLVY